MSTQQFNWSKATAEERDALCASFMPPSPVNPMRKIQLVQVAEIDGKEQITYRGTLSVESLEEGEAWLKKVKGSRDFWKRIFDKPSDPTWNMQSQIQAREQTWHMRYSETPGGAMNLLLHIAKEKNVVFEFYQRDGQWIVAYLQPTSPERPRQWHPEFSAAACMAFLDLNGVAVEVDEDAEQAPPGDR